MFYHSLTSLCSTTSGKQFPLLQINVLISAKNSPSPPQLSSLKSDSYHQEDCGKAEIRADSGGQLGRKVHFI